MSRAEITGGVLLDTIGHLSTTLIRFPIVYKIKKNGPQYEITATF